MPLISGWGLGSALQDPGVRLVFLNQEPLSCLYFVTCAGCYKTLPPWLVSPSHDRSADLPTQLPRWLSGKESSCQGRRHWFHPWVGKIPWRRKWQPTPVFLPGESHERRSLVGRSPHRVAKNWARLSNQTTGEGEQQRSRQSQHVCEAVSAAQAGPHTASTPAKPHTHLCSLCLCDKAPRICSSTGFALCGIQPAAGLIPLKKALITVPCRAVVAVGKPFECESPHFPTMEL